MMFNGECYSSFCYLPLATAAATATATTAAAAAAAAAAAMGAVVVEAVARPTMALTTKTATKHRQSLRRVGNVDRVIQLFAK